jgi:hypothetical protein
LVCRYPLDSEYVSVSFPVYFQDDPMISRGMCQYFFMEDIPLLKVVEC